MKKKTRQVKAKRMWLCQAMSDPHYLVAYSSFKEAEATRMGRYEPSIPLFVLPATAEAYDAMEEAGAKAMFITETEPGKKPASYAKATQYMKEYYRALSRAFLTALALVRPTK